MAKVLSDGANQSPARQEHDMEKTWAFGAIELLRHAASHINLESAELDRFLAQHRRRGKQGVYAQVE
jgi:hypothetical protein